MAKPEFVSVLYIATTAEKLWAALTRGYRSSGASWRRAGRSRRRGAEELPDGHNPGGRRTRTLLGVATTKHLSQVLASGAESHATR